MAPLKRVLCAWCICFPVPRYGVSIRCARFLTRFTVSEPLTGVRLPLSPFSARRFVRWYFNEGCWMVLA